MPATEHSEQCALVERCLYSGYPYNLIAAVPNGGLRTKGVAGQMKAEGVRKGYEDLQLLVARGGYHGLLIEMKAKGGRLSPEQEIWIANHRAEGYRVEVCYGQDAAWQVLTEYVQGKLVRDSSLRLREAIER